MLFQCRNTESLTTITTNHSIIIHSKLLARKCGIQFFNKSKQRRKTNQNPKIIAYQGSYSNALINTNSKKLPQIIDKNKGFVSSIIYLLYLLLFVQLFGVNKPFGIQNLIFLLFFWWVFDYFSLSIICYTHTLKSDLPLILISHPCIFHHNPFIYYTNKLKQTFMK